MTVAGQIPPESTPAAKMEPFASLVASCSTKDLPAEAGSQVRNSGAE